MDNEVYRTLAHHEARDIMAEDLRQHGFTVQTEWRLPHGRIADIIATSQDGTVLIVEVKTRLRLSEMIEAYDKYGAYSTHLLFAVADLDHDTACDVTASPLSIGRAERVGLVGIYRDGIAAIKKPTPRPMHAAIYADLCIKLGLEAQPR